MNIQKIHQKYAEQTNREVSELDEYDLHVCNVVKSFLKQAASDREIYLENQIKISDDLGAPHQEIALLKKLLREPIITG